jgi:hypothetical protein
LSRSPRRYNPGLSSRQRKARRCHLPCNHGPVVVIRSSVGDVGGDNAPIQQHSVEGNKETLKSHVLPPSGVYTQVIDYFSCRNPSRALWTGKIGRPFRKKALGYSQRVLVEVKKDESRTVEWFLFGCVPSRFSARSRCGNANSATEE